MPFEEEGKKSTERWPNKRRCGIHVQVGELVEIAFDVEGVVNGGSKSEMGGKMLQCVLRPVCR